MTFYYNIVKYSHSLYARVGYIGRFRLCVWFRFWACILLVIL